MTANCRSLAALGMTAYGLGMTANCRSLAALGMTASPGAQGPEVRLESVRDRHRFVLLPLRGAHRVLLLGHDDVPAFHENGRHPRRAHHSETAEMHAFVGQRLAFVQRELDVARERLRMRAIEEGLH